LDTAVKFRYGIEDVGNQSYIRNRMKSKLNVSYNSVQKPFCSQVWPRKLED